MPNEVIIRVKAINDTKAVFDRVRADAHDLGDDVAVTITTRSNQRMQQEAASGGAYRQTGEIIGNTIGERVAQQISERVRVTVQENVRRDANGRLRDSRGRFVNDGSSSSTSRSRSDSGGNGDNDHVRVSVDVDKQSFLQRIGSLGREASGKLSESLRSGLSSVFSGDVISTAVKAVGIAMAGAMALPIIGAAFISTILLALGGGAIAAGIVSAMKDPAIQEAAHDVMGKISQIFTGFGENFKGPIREFFGIGGGSSSGGHTGILGILEQIQPLVEDLGKTLGPIAGQLGEGIIGFLQNVLPGVIRAMKDSGPIIQVLADSLPKLGDDIAKFFDKMRQGAPYAATFFNDLIALVGLVLRVFGDIILGAARLYTVFRTVFAGMINVLGYFVSAAAIAFGWMPGIGPKLTTAAHKFAQFRDNVNRSLEGIDKNVNVNIRFRVFGQSVANTAIRTAELLHSMGYAHGGTIGSAATGGVRSGMTLVGEHGPELINAAPGSRVSSNADTRRALGADGGQGSGSGGEMRVAVYIDGRQVADAIAEPMRGFVRDRFGGSVQAAYGYGE